MRIDPKRLERGLYWSKIWQLVEGCTPISPGCDHCWSARDTNRFSHNPAIKNRIKKTGLVDSDLKFIGQIRLRPDLLEIPFYTRKPSTFFVLNDLHHESVPLQFRGDAYSVMRGFSGHTYLVLTKRPHEMVRFFKGDTLPGYTGRDHIWHGLTICNQPEADLKIPEFLKVPGKKFLSIEPMLGPIDIFFLHLTGYSVPESYDGLGHKYPAYKKAGIDAVLLGGESGPGARPMHPDWVRSIRDQCAAAGVPFFFKQWGGSYKNYFGGHTPGRFLDGREHNELPWAQS